MANQLHLRFKTLEPPESTAGMVESDGFADVATVSGVICGVVVDGGGGEVRLVVVLDVVSKVK